MAIILTHDIDAQNTARIRNLPAPTNAGDAATKAYVDSLIEGLSWKDDVRVATTANISLSTPPSVIDGVTLAVGDRILVKDQTAQAENGIYVYNGTGNALTRAPDANTGDELNAAVVTVVSIPHWCDLNPASAYSSAITTLVSIPHWCDLNPTSSTSHVAA
jgi:phage-related tail fiber protein